MKKHVEDGNDDCGDDLSGLGQVLMATWSADVPVELISSDEEDDLFLALPTSMPDAHTRTYIA
eukprot:9028304-Pyramimonas_sp.AAC.1